MGQSEPLDSGSNVENRQMIIALSRILRDRVQNSAYSLSIPLEVFDFSRMLPKVSIVIINWNTWSLTKDCLVSLQNLNYENFEVILIDNDSKEEDKRMLRALPIWNERFIFIEHSENAGFSGGNNVGIKYALQKGTDYVLLLNNDTIVDDKLLVDKMVKVAENSAKIGVVGPKIFYYPETPQQGSGQIFPRRGKIWFGGGRLNWLKNEGEHLKLEEQTKVDFITGCCLLIKKEVIDKIGLMPEEFFLYFEDSDWCLKAQEAGYDCVYEPSAWLWHKVSSTTKEFSYGFIYYNTRNGLLLAWRHNGWLKRLIVLFLAVRIIIKQIFKIVLWYKKEWSRAMLRGALDFLRGKFGKMK